jgi:hypothetical protein
MMKVRLGAAIMVAALAFCIASPRTCDADRDGSRQVMRQKPPSGKPARGHGSGAPNLIDHGGPVLSTPHVYSIFWGSFSPSDLQVGLAGFFGGFGGSSYSNILTQYLHNAPNPSSTYLEFGTDMTSSPPSRSPSVSTIVNEACKFIVGTPDPDGVYFVITSNFPKSANFCAWHSAGTCNGVTIPVVYLPNTSGIAGYDPGNLFSANSYSEGTRSMANIAAHELSEVITDPQLNAWFDSGGQEIGDKCAWQFQSAVTLRNGSKWQLQEEWSNAASGCVQMLP